MSFAPFDQFATIFKPLDVDLENFRYRPAAVRPMINRLWPLMVASVPGNAARKVVTHLTPGRSPFGADISNPHQFG
jgi:hypothetical protein